MTNQTPEPDDLRALGAELDEAHRRDGSRHKAPPPTPIGIAFRFSTEMVSALVVGGLIGWGLDWLFGTKPILMIVFFVLGAVAGIRNVMRAAKQLNARAAAENSEN